MNSQMHISPTVQLGLKRKLDEDCLDVNAKPEKSSRTEKVTPCILGIGVAKPRSEDGTSPITTKEDYIRWQKKYLNYNTELLKKSHTTNGTTASLEVDEKEMKEKQSKLEKQFALVKRLCENSGIDQRSYASSDIVNPEECPQLLHHNPSNFSRAEIWSKVAPKMSLEAAKMALEESGITRPSDCITHVVTHSCTGWKAPGLSFGLVDGLNLRRTTRRMEVNFMGCFGASTALYAARNIIVAEPEAVVLVVCTELCTLHIARDAKPENMIGNVLFGDGCAATVVAARSSLSRIRSGSLKNNVTPSTSTSTSTTTPPSTFGSLCNSSSNQWEFCKFGSTILPGSQNAMLWKQGKHNYDMILSREIPKNIAQYLQQEAKKLPSLCGLKSKNLNDIAYCLHPGGRAILDVFKKIYSQFGVDPSSVDCSYKVLREHGNMSSPTILYVLKELIKTSDKDEIMILVFGPGLTIEYIGMRRIK